MRIYNNCTINYFSHSLPKTTISGYTWFKESIWWLNAILFFCTLSLNFFCPFNKVLNLVESRTNNRKAFAFKSDESSSLWTPSFFRPSKNLFWNLFLCLNFQCRSPVILAFVKYKILSLKLYFFIVCRMDVTLFFLHTWSILIFSCFFFNFYELM